MGGKNFDKRRVDCQATDEAVAGPVGSCINVSKPQISVKQLGRLALLIHNFNPGDVLGHGNRWGL